MPEHEQFCAGGGPPRDTRCFWHGDIAISVAQTKEPSNRRPGVPGRDWPCASADATERTMTDLKRRQGQGLSHLKVPDIASHTPEALIHNHPQTGATSIIISCEKQVLEESEFSFSEMRSRRTICACVDGSESVLREGLDRARRGFLDEVMTRWAKGSRRNSSPRASTVRPARRRFR